MGTRNIVALLVIVMCVGSVTAVAATPVGQCTLAKWTGVAGPAGKNFGPDSNEAFDPKYALKLVIPKGRTAYFTFWSATCTNPETAIVLYDKKFSPLKREAIGLRGNNHGYAPGSLKGPLTVVITGWHKDPAGRWAGDYSKPEPYPHVANMWIAGVDTINSAYRDFVALINCR